MFTAQARQNYLENFAEDNSVTGKYFQLNFGLWIEGLSPPYSLFTVADDAVIDVVRQALQQDDGEISRIATELVLKRNSC